jgi:Mor family transcriptional regulator
MKRVIILMSKRRSEMSNSSDSFFQCVAEAASIALQGAKLGQMHAEGFGALIAERVCRNLGGQMIYIPRGRRLDLIKRNEEIYAKFRGDNHGELARRYGLCERSIHLIIKKERGRRQPQSTGAKSAAVPGGAP